MTRRYENATRLIDVWKEFFYMARVLNTRKATQLWANNKALQDALASQGLKYTPASCSALDHMFCALAAVRKVCSSSDAERYRNDMECIAEYGPLNATVLDMLTMSGFGSYESANWYDTARSLDSEIVITEDGYFCYKSNAYYCEYSDRYFKDDSLTSVHVNRRTTQEWSEDARESHAFFCDISEEWYACGYYSSSRTDNESTICSEIASDYDYTWSDRHECYSQESDEDEDEDDEEEGRSTIPDYHKATRRWTLDVANRSTRAFYGFEIEVRFDDSDDRENFWSEHLGCNINFCGELDGSLNDDLGLEVVTRPFPMQELRAPVNVLRTLLTQLRNDGASGDETGYGVHITSNWGRLSPPHKIRMRKFIYTMKPLTIFVSKREETRYASFNDNLDDSHTAAHVRNREALEIRTFQSTTDYDRLMSYVEYIEALTEWTRDPERSVLGPMAQSGFRYWVCASGIYPFLATRFAPKKKETVQCV